MPIVHYDCTSIVHCVSVRSFFFEEEGGKGEDEQVFGDKLGERN